MTGPARVWPAASLLHASVAALFAAGVSGTLVAAEPTSAAVGLAWLSAGILLYVVVAIGAASPRLWKPAAVALGAIAALAALYTVLQYRHLEFPDKVAFVSELGAATSAWLPALPGWHPFPNSLAMLLEAALPLVVGLAAGRTTASRLRRWAIGASVLVAVALLLTASRGAWIAEGLVVLFALAAVWPRADHRSRRLIPVAAGVLLTVLVGLSLVLASRAFAPDGADAVAWMQRPDRLAIQGHALTLAHDFPFTGVGLGDAFAPALARHALLIDVPFLTYGHHLVLDVWLELGLAGLLALAALVAALVVGASAGERLGCGSGFRGAYLGAFAWLFHGLTDGRPAVDGWTWLPLFALLGLVAARLGSHRVGSWAARAVGVVPAGVAVAVLAWVWPLPAAWHVNQGGLAELQARAAGASAGSALAAGEPHYRAALAWHTANSTAHRRLGQLAAAQDRPGPAVEHLEAALRGDADSWATRKALGLAYLWAGRPADAERWLRSLGADEAIAQELDTWSWWQEQRGQPRLALYAADVVQRLRPNAATAARVALLAGAAARQSAP